jgi:hypothetical protein
MSSRSFSAGLRHPAWATGDISRRGRLHETGWILAALAVLGLAYYSMSIAKYCIELHDWLVPRQAQMVPMDGVSPAGGQPVLNAHQRETERAFERLSVLGTHGSCPDGQTAK